MLDHLKTIPIDSRLNSRLIFLADQKEMRDVERYLMKTMNLSNPITTRLGDTFRWRATAKSLGYHVVIHTQRGQGISSIKPKWLEKCRFHSNQLYEWAAYNGTVVVRFNPELMKQIKNQKYNKP